MVIFGVGCAGNRMLNELGTGELFGINTDKEELERCIAGKKLLLSPARRWHEYSEVDGIAELCQGPVVILAGLGGGTGSAAVPMVALIAKEQGCHVTAIVTLPFWFEGLYRRRIAARAVKRIRADRLITIPLSDPPMLAKMRDVWEIGVKAGVAAFENEMARCAAG
jgi:cell division GTPase FtsZ